MPSQADRNKLLLSLYLRALQLCEERGVDPQKPAEDAPEGAVGPEILELDMALIEVMRAPFGPGEFDSMMAARFGKRS